MRVGKPSSDGVRPALVVVALLGLWSCSGFDESTPENVLLRMSGATGTEIQLVLSTRFVAGVNEVGVTEVRLVRSDTIVRTLPVDTVISVAVDQRFFVEAMPVEPDTLEVQVRLDVDQRGLFDRRGLIFQEVPFRYVYLFNQRVTRTVEVLL